MKLKKIMLITILIMMFCLSIGGVNALSVEPIGTHIDLCSGDKIKNAAPEFHTGEEHFKNKNKDSMCYNGYNKKCKHYGKSHLQPYIYGNTEIRSIKRVTVKINSKTVKNFKNFKFKNFKHDTVGYFTFDTYVKGNVKGKKITLSAYNSKNKLIASKTATIKRVETRLMTKFY